MRYVLCFMLQKHLASNENRAPLGKYIYCLTGEYLKSFFTGSYLDLATL
jgi:hypothetical protein